MLKVQKIYLEPEVPSYKRGRDILEHFPDAERVEVPSHWNIPSLHGNEGSVEDWVRIKRDVLVLGVRKSLPVRVNGRSADFIAPGASNGCAMACAYCVTEGTLVTTPKGPVPVERIRDGDEVIAFGSSSERLVTAAVSGTVCRDVDEVLEIELSDTTLRVTANHPLWTRRGWVKAGDLNGQDEVLCDDGRTG